MNRYPAETNEFAPISITVNGSVPLTANIKLQILPRSARVTNTWIDPVVEGNQIGFMVNGFTVGFYSVWAKILNGVGVPIFIIDSFQIT